MTGGSAAADQPANYLVSMVVVVTFALVPACTGAPGDAMAAGHCVGGELNIVAHPDDDLLFLSPDIADAIASNQCVQTVYVTAGDAGEPAPYWTEREDGVKAAYALLAGVPDAWHAEAEVVDGHVIRTLVLDADPNVSLTFLALPDGMDGAGAPRAGRASLARLWRGLIHDIDTVDGGDRFDRGSLISLLAELMRRSGGRAIRIQDRTGAFGHDHSDHRNAARFAFAAFQTLSTDGATLTMYRGYNISHEPSNLDEAKAHEKWRAFERYVADDSRLGYGHDPIVASTYTPWAYRQYPLSAAEPAGELLVDVLGRCVKARSSDATPGTRLELARCVDAPEQLWALLPDGHLRNGGLCLAITTDRWSERTPIGLQSCGETESQRWAHTVDDRIVASGRCLSALDRRLDDSELAVAPCGDLSTQQWRLVAP